MNIIISKKNCRLHCSIMARAASGAGAINIFGGRLLILDISFIETAATNCTDVAVSILIGPLRISKWIYTIIK